MAQEQFEEANAPAKQQSSNLLPPQTEPYERTPGTPRQVAYHPWSRPRSSWNPSGLEDERQERLARRLGWFSIGLGMMQIAAPRTFCRLIGLNDRHGLIRSVGIREIVSGVGILSRRKPTIWMWSRVAGDIMDLTVLGIGLVSRGTHRSRIAAATVAVTGVTVLDYQLSQELSDSPGPQDNRISIQVVKSITINRPAEDVYNRWRDYQNLPRFMRHLESVQMSGDNRSHWVAKGPAGKRVEWDAETTEDRPNELIAWRSLEGAAVKNSGSVRFESAPGGRGTIVRVELEYYPPAGLLGARIAKLWGEEPAGQVADDLRRLKQLMETGDIITTEGQSAGRAASTSWKFDHAGARLAASF